MTGRVDADFTDYENSVAVPKDLFINLLRHLEQHEFHEQRGNASGCASEQTRRLLDPLRQCGRKVGVY